MMCILSWLYCLDAGAGLSSTNGILVEVLAKPCVSATQAALKL